eukprot:6376116-Pyramimonas_sp.AAC.1
MHAPPVARVRAQLQCTQPVRAWLAPPHQVCDERGTRQLKEYGCGMKEGGGSALSLKIIGKAWPSMPASRVCPTTGAALTQGSMSAALDHI